MHAYASYDPVFLAMNRRAQEETSGELGDFCVRCHAPVATALGLTDDGLNLEALPEAVQGVGCYACHGVEALEGDHNGAMRLATDGVLRGGLSDPRAGAPHGIAYSELLDGERAESSGLCGACHDVVLPGGLELERTYQEWSHSAFGPERAASEGALLSCAGCHMPETNEPVVAAGTTGSEPRPGMHDHTNPAVDVALAPFPRSGDEAADRAAEADQRARVRALLDTSLGVEVCVQALAGDTSAIFVTLENASAGHSFPSGAAQDRRVWVELRARRGDALLFESGDAGPGDPGAPIADDDTWSFMDRIYDEDDRPTTHFWNARRIESSLIPAATTFDPAARDFLNNHVTRRYPRSRDAAIPGVPDRVEVVVRVRPIGLEILEDLERSGHLARELIDAAPTFDIIPNRHLAEHPALSNLAAVTFEWSGSVKDSGLFSTRILRDEAYAKDCVGSIRRN
jgi:cytochrome c554/c'-like protein